MNPSQVILALFSGAGIMFLGLGLAVPGCALGLVAQPFWIRETYKARQWGMFALSLWYTVAWANGLAVNLWGLG